MEMGKKAEKKTKQEPDFSEAGKEKRKKQTPKRTQKSVKHFKLAQLWGTPGPFIARASSVGAGMGGFGSRRPDGLIRQEAMRNSSRTTTTNSTFVREIVATANMLFQRAPEGGDGASPIWLETGDGITSSKSACKWG